MAARTCAGLNQLCFSPQAARTRDGADTFRAPLRPHWHAGCRNASVAPKRLRLISQPVMNTIKQKLIFRSLILAEFVFTLADIIVGLHGRNQYPEQVQKVHTALLLQFYGSYIKPLLVLGIFLATFKVFSGIGLFFYWKPAKWIYILSTISVIFCNAVLTPGIETLWEDIFGTLSLCTGVWIIAMLSYAEIKKEFL